jgi:sporulation-control protein
MVLRRLLALGVDIDTILFDSQVVPGGDLVGDVRLIGGPVDHRVEGITLALIAGEWASGQGTRQDEFHRVSVSGPFTLPAQNRYVVPFRVPMPWETPLSEVNGQPIEDQFIRVRTELALAGAVDKGDTDPLTVRALPAQQRIIDALANLGFHYFFADIERGTLKGSALPIYQEIEFRPPPRYESQMRELELTFIAGPSSVDVIMEGGFDYWNRSTVEYRWLDEELGWEAWLDERIALLKRP